LDEDWVGLITLQVGCFRRFTQQAIDADNGALALKCFQFVDDNMDEVEFSIENSLVISWLGKLIFDKNPVLFSRLPVKLEKLYTDLKNEYSKPPNKKAADFLKRLDDDLN